jgi:uncharacterized protein YdcH (DUF465 family)
MTDNMNKPWRLTGRIDYQRAAATPNNHAAEIATKDAEIARLTAAVQFRDEVIEMRDQLLESRGAEIERLRKACSQVNDEVCQTLGKALGYPFYKDDQKNFPGATEANGVCVGEHVAESLAAEAADEIARLRQQLAEAEKLVRHCWVHTGYPDCGSQQMTTEQRDRYLRIIHKPIVCSVTT